MQNDVSVRVLILGSCVSRDVLDYHATEKRDLKLVDYYARSSMASLAAIPFQMPLPACLNKIKSAFQLRMVQRDMQKTFFEDLKTAEFDILLLDLIDERFNLWLDSLGTICTLSSELVQTGFLSQHSAGREIVSGSEEFWKLWETGWSIFVGNLATLGLINRLRINKVFWCPSTQRGRDFSSFYSRNRIATANELLERMYRRIERDIPQRQLLTFDQNQLQAADSHKWGISPFHYVNEYYVEARRQLLLQKNLVATQAKSTVRLSNRNITTTAAYDPAAWGGAIHQCGSIESTIYANVNSDGIYQIQLTDNWALDLCAQGMHLLKNQGKDRIILVGLSGAVANRIGKKAPFFSGLSIAKSLELPIISVADPTLAMDPDLPLSWYAGSEEFPNLPKQLAFVLDSLANIHNARLVIFGGSGGGYAGLMMATLLECQATVLVWNPQTAIADYVPHFVAQYIEAAFPRLGESVSRVRVGAAGEQSEGLREILNVAAITHDVRNIQLRPQINLLYLQNQSDWHVARHTAPYLVQGSWRRMGQAAFVRQQDVQIGLFFGQWGDGHAAPPKAVLEVILRKLVDGEPVIGVMQELDAGIPGLCDGPAYFPWPVTHSVFRLEASASVANEKVHATCSAEQEPTETEGVTYAFYLLIDGVRHAMRWYDPRPEAYFKLMNAKGKLEVIAFARDRLGGQVSVRIPVQPAGTVELTTDRVGSKLKMNCLTEIPLLDQRESSNSSDQEIDYFAQNLVENVKNLPEVRLDWRKFSKNPEIESVFSGFLVLRTGFRLPLGLDFSIDWRFSFSENVQSNVLWLYSLDYVGTLFSAYESVNQEKYLIAAVGIVQSFLDFVDESDENRLLILTLRRGGSSQDHAVATRTNVFVKILHILGGLDKYHNLAFRVARCLHTHGLFLMDDGNYAQSNHGIMSDLALAQLGAALGIASVQGTQFLNKAIFRLISAIHRTFDRDGFANENTVGYHRFNMVLYGEAVMWFSKWQVDERFASEARPILQRAETALRFAVWPDGSIPPIGDSPVYSKVTRSINKSCLFSESHFGVIKSDDLYVSFVCGWRSKGHKQVDDTSLTIRYLNTDIVIDAGSYSYDRKDPLRQCLESSFGHSGIFLTAMDGLSPSAYFRLEPAAKITDWVEHPLGVRVMGEVKFAKWGVTLHRRVEVLWPNRILVSDQVIIDEGFPPMTARQSWLLGEGMRFGKPWEDGAHETVILDNGTVCATLRFSNSSEKSSTETYFGSTHPSARGWCSQTFGKISPTMELSRYQSGMLMEFNVEIELGRL